MKKVCWSCDTFDEGRCEGCTTSCDKCSACPLETKIELDLDGGILGDIDEWRAEFNIGRVSFISFAIYHFLYDLDIGKVTNSDVRNWLLDKYEAEDISNSTDQQLGKYDAEVIDGRGYYDESGSFCKFSDSF